MNSMRFLKESFRSSLMVLALSSASCLFGQTPTVVDGAFTPGTGADDDVFALAFQPDGRIVLGGQFVSFNGAGRARIARLNEDGSVDGTFAPGGGANGNVYAVALQADGKVLIGGGFTTVNGASHAYLARLLTNGLPDPDFNPPAINNELRAVVVQPDDRILIAGRFTSVGGKSRGRVARLLPDGSLDADFAPGSGANDNVRCLALLTGGHILIGGQFTNYSGITRHCIAQLRPTGDLDPSFDPGQGADHQVRAIAVATNGLIYIGGDFEVYNGTNRSALARLFPDGGLDLTFAVPGDPAGDIVRAIALPTDEAIWVGGLFSQAGGAARRNLARLRLDGTADPAYPPGFGCEDEVFALSPRPDGRLIAGGKFAWFDQASWHRIARFFGNPAIPSFEFTATNFVGVEAVGAAGITVQRRGDPQSTVSVDVVTAPGTALPGVDYVATETTLTFAASEITQILAIPLLKDAQVELPKTFSLQLTNLSRGTVLGARPRAQVKIVDDGGQIAWATPTVTVGENQYGYARVVAYRTGDASVQVAVPVQTHDLTAHAGLDYQATSGWLTFPENERTAVADIPVFNDLVQNGDRAFQVTLGWPTNGATLGGQTNLEVTILDNEIGFVFRGPTFWFSESGGAATMTVDLLWDTTNATSVHYRTTTGTATPEVDYLPQAGVLEFALGEHSKTFSIPILNDGLEEVDETIGLVLEDPTGGVTLGPQWEATAIIQNWPERGLEFVATRYVVPERASNVVVQVKRGDDSTNDFTVEFATVGGTARAGLDYLPTNGTLTLPPGGIVAVTIPILNDTVRESDETFSVILRNPGPGASLGADHETLVRIIDDDGRPGSMDLDFADTLGDTLSILGFLPSASVMVQSDGRIVVGAWDTVWRFRRDGTLDTNFPVNGFGFRWEGPAFAEQTNGCVLVGTVATNWGPLWARVLYRLATNGVPEPDFATNLSLGWTRAIAVQPDGRILIGGNFDRSWYTGEATTDNGVLRLQTNGTVDGSFSVGLFQPATGLFDQPGVVSCLLLQPDGRVVVGGAFTNVAGTPCDGVARLLPNGSVDADFFHAPQGVTNHAIVTAMALMPDGRIVVGGAFATLQGAPRFGLARINPDGTVDPSFTAPLNSTHVVNTLAVQADGKVLVGGGGPPWWDGAPPFLLRLHSNGSIDTSFDIGAPPDGRVTSLAVEADGNILVAGDFTYWNDLRRPMLVRLFGDGLCFGPPTMRPGVFQMELSNVRPGIPVVLFASINLVQWEPVQTNSLATPPVRFFETNTSGVRQRFFRAAQPTN
jgi:uncharacterized delta-60 repeat protein